jgi:hypothetical protein
LSVIEIEPLAGLPSRDLVTELVDNGTRLVRTVGGTLVNVPERPAEYRAAEALLRIASGCSGVPGAPTDLRVEQSHTVVQLRWIGSTGHPSSYVLEAGGASGSTATANDLGNPEPRFTGIRVERGTYYARIRGKNACGVGAPSNEVVVVVR